MNQPTIELMLENPFGLEGEKKRNKWGFYYIAKVEKCRKYSSFHTCTRTRDYYLSIGEVECGNGRTENWI